MKGLSRVLGVMMVCGCGALMTEYPVEDGHDTAIQTIDTGEEDAQEWVDPFAAREVYTAGLTNTSEVLERVLEHGQLADACHRYRSRPTDESLKLLCGKSMFFYETFGTSGVPKGLVDILLRSFEEQLGVGFSQLGLTADPYSSEHYPLGMALAEDGSTVSFTCASCHFAQLDDGRYSVGAPNHKYEYGLHNLVFAVFPAAVTGGLMSPVAPEAEARLQPLIDAFNDDLGARIQLYGWMATMLGRDIPEFSEDAQRHYAQWKPGTMDFFIEPLPIDDGVHTVSKISALWGIPSPDERAEAGMEHALLGHTGNTRSLANFAMQFVTLGGGDETAWTTEKMEPLVAYIHSLEAPVGPKRDPETVTRGARLYQESGCLSCHQGPRGSGLRLFSFEDIGTDDALKYWMDPTGTGIGMSGVDMGEDTVTNALKSPRLVGLWTMDRFLHNGSVESLEDLLCLDDGRPSVEGYGYGAHGHMYGCDLTPADKMDLIHYLNAH